MKTTNAMQEIYPYWTGATWAFDDDRVGLVAEPFVLGADMMITEVLHAKGANMSQVNQGFRLQFSANPFPQTDITIRFDREDSGGAWYTVTDSPHQGLSHLIEAGFKGWLCPAMYHYFSSAPESIHMRAVV